MLYNEDYYLGKGADPLVDYVYEQDHPDRTIRQFEWRGTVRVARSLLGQLMPETRWLDFGCGNGGLVRYVRQHVGCDIAGYDSGWAASRAKQLGVQILDEAELASREGTYDLVTAMEVIEHVPDPLDVLRQIRRLLRPGGTLLLTTGNAKPFRDNLLNWRYLRPDIHVSYFEPETVERAMKIAGFEPDYPGFVPGYDDIIRFKLLKNLRRRDAMWVHSLVPWSLASRALDWGLRITALPIGRVPV